MANETGNKILITGGSGLLGLNWGYHAALEHDVVLALHDRIINPEGMDVVTLNLGSTDDLLAATSSINPSCIVHTAGLTSIEKCEEKPEIARHVNAEIASNVAATCRELQIPMIHVSTDNLYDGKTAMVDESHPVNPVNEYGKTKAEAEQKILSIFDDVVIVRTNFYGWGPVYKPSFSDTIINSLRAAEPVSLFSDVYYTPVLISELVTAAHQLLEGGHRGIFNICSDKRLSKYDFGLKIADIFGLDGNLINKGRLADLTHLTNRPYDMSMSNKKTCDLLGRSIGDVSMHLEKLKMQENYLETQEIRSVDSLR